MTDSSAIKQRQRGIWISAAADDSWPFWACCDLGGVLITRVAWSALQIISQGATRSSKIWLAGGIPYLKQLPPIMSKKLTSSFNMGGEEARRTIATLDSPSNGSAGGSRDTKASWHNLPLTQQGFQPICLHYVCMHMQQQWMDELGKKK